MLRILLILISLLGCGGLCATSLAQSTSDSLLHNSINNNEPIVLYNNYSLINESNLIHSGFKSLNNLNLNYLQYDNDVSIIQNGLDNKAFKINVNSYFKILNKKKNIKDKAVWGYAQYLRGRKDKVIMNETSDYDYLYPYIVSDTVGGDNLKYEEYKFKGGYVQKVDRNTFSVSLAYRALREYRTIDPRPDNTSSKLDVKFSYSYKVLRDYNLGLALDLSTYKQNNNLIFNSHLGAPLVYQETGLGNFNKLISGKSEAILFDAYTVAPILSFTPTNGKGFSFLFKYNYFYYEKQLKNHLFTPITYINENKYSAISSYISSNGIFSTKLTLNYKSRKGTEDQFQLGTGTYLKKISSYSPYLHTNIYLDYDMMWRIFNIGGNEGYINFSLLYDKSDESHNRSKRFINYQNIKESISFNYMSVFTKSYFKMIFQIASRQNLSKMIDLPGLSESELSYQSLHHNYNFVTTNYLSLALKLNYKILLSPKILLNLQAKGEYKPLFIKGLSNYNMIFSCGLEF